MSTASSLPTRHVHTAATAPPWVLSFIVALFVLWCDSVPAYASSSARLIAPPSLRGPAVTLAQEQGIALTVTRATPHHIPITPLTERELNAWVDTVEQLWAEGDFSGLARVDWRRVTNAQSWIPAHATLFLRTRDALLLLLTAALIDEHPVLAQTISDAMLDRYDLDLLCQGSDFPEACAFLAPRYEARALTPLLSEAQRTAFVRHSGLALVQLEASPQRTTLYFSAFGATRSQTSVQRGDAQNDDLRALLSDLRSSLDRASAAAPLALNEPRSTRAARLTPWAVAGTLSAGAIASQILRAKSLRSHERCTERPYGECRGTDAFVHHQRRVARANTSAWAMTGVSLSATIVAGSFSARSASRRSPNTERPSREDAIVRTPDDPPDNAVRFATDNAVDEYRLEALAVGTDHPDRRDLMATTTFSPTRPLRASRVPNSPSRMDDEENPHAERGLRIPARATPQRPGRDALRLESSLP